MEAFEQHPQWRTDCPVQSQDEGFSDADEYYVPSADAAASQFVWAEYERLDWERIYAGETTLHDMPKSVPDCIRELRMVFKESTAHTSSIPASSSPGFW